MNNYKSFGYSLCFVTLLFLSLCANALEYRSDETRYPVILAHGTGIHAIGGYHYFGEDYWGTFVGDACSMLEINGCNDWIAHGQQKNNKAMSWAVTPLQDPITRGDQLFNHVLDFMATTGHTHVNLVGHSMGGFDIRYVAHRLKEHFGEARVKALISISTPHRGTSNAKRLLDQYARDEYNIFCALLPSLQDGSDPCLAAFFDITELFGDLLSGLQPGSNDAIAAMTSVVYNDYDTQDGRLTGARQFNQNYNVDHSVATYYASIVSAQDNGKRHPIYLGIVASLGYNADGDGYCHGDCDNNGSAGTGDGLIYDGDDDGLAELNSQQMGYRLQYHADDCAGFLCLLGDPLDRFTEVTETGYVADLNNPNSTQMTSHAGVLDADHTDMISIGPDDIDEEEFYAAIFDFIHSKGF